MRERKGGNYLDNRGVPQYGDSERFVLRPGVSPHIQEQVNVVRDPQGTLLWVGMEGSARSPRHSLGTPGTLVAGWRSSHIHWGWEYECRAIFHRGDMFAEVRLVGPQYWEGGYLDDIEFPGGVRRPEGR